MKYNINNNILSQVSTTLGSRSGLYWVVGGAGSGKTTICRILSDRYSIPVYDMDAHIYGSYHSRFTKERHPVNYAWSNSKNSLEWLLSISWEEFNDFNRAALPEYLDLLAEDIRTKDPTTSHLIDGGICNPGVLSKVLSVDQIVCLANPGYSSQQIWEANKERRAMKEMVYQLPKPEEAWQKFLEFDKKITQTILKECSETNIAVCKRSRIESPTDFSERVAKVLKIQVTPE